MKNIKIHAFTVIACLASSVLTSGIHVSRIEHVSYSVKNRKRFKWDRTYSSQP